MPRPFPELLHPIVQAPLAGGPSTPELAAAVSTTGGLGFLAAGYLTAERLRSDIARYRELSAAPFGVNVFWLVDESPDLDHLSAYAGRLRAEAELRDTELGPPRFEDDALAAKLALLVDERPAVISFTFGCPSAEVVERLHRAEIAVWATVTEPQEATLALGAGVDALVAQGVEAGGHRASFSDADGVGELGLFSLLRLLGQESELPLVAAGGIADGTAVAAAIVAGAVAAQIGTGFMLCPEAGTSAPHREALRGTGPTALTRAFTGRRARGIVNRFQAAHSAHAPSAYPYVHHLTSPLRAAAREAGDGEMINLWAGQSYPLAQELPAAELIRRWDGEAQRAIERARFTV